MVSVTSILDDGGGSAEILEQGQAPTATAATTAISPNSKKRIRAAAGATAAAASSSRDGEASSNNNNNNNSGNKIYRRSLLERKEGRRRLRKEKYRYAYAPDCSGDKGHYDESYHFWTSRPVLAMLTFVILAIQFRTIYWLAGALAVFLYEVAVVLVKWNIFIVNHPTVQSWAKVTRGWIKFGVKQAEYLMNRKDRVRKGAMGAFYMNYEMTFNVVGGYLQVRKDQVLKYTLAEAQRLQNRLAAAAEAVQSTIHQEVQIRTTRRQS